MNIYSAPRGVCYDFGKGLIADPILLTREHGYLRRHTQIPTSQNRSRSLVCCGTQRDRSRNAVTISSPSSQRPMRVTPLITPSCFSLGWKSPQPRSLTAPDTSFTALGITTGSQLFTEFPSSSTQCLSKRADNVCFLFVPSVEFETRYLDLSCFGCSVPCSRWTPRWRGKLVSQLVAERRHNPCRYTTISRCFKTATAQRQHPSRHDQHGVGSSTLPRLHSGAVSSH